MNRSINTQYIYTSVVELVSLASLIKLVPHQLLSLHNFSCPLRLDFCSLSDNINDSAELHQPRDFLQNIACPAVGKLLANNKQA